MPSNINPTDSFKELTPSMPGKVVSVSSNVLMALSLIQGYLNSTYDLQMADTQLQAAITNQETNLVQNFQKQMNATGVGPWVQQPNGQWVFYPGWINTGGLLWRIQQLIPTTDPNGTNYYSTDMQTLVTEYSAANAANQAQVKVLDSNNSTAQNILNQNSQGQTGIIQLMQSLNTIGSNLVRILQG